MEPNFAMGLMAIPLMLLIVAILGLVVTHLLASIGIGEGTPWTARASQKLYKGDASLLGLAIAIAWVAGMIYAQWGNP